jgi:hypothetical protein
MTETVPDRFEGASCTATLDTNAQTLTFSHRGFGASAQQKALSPLVVPLGAIGDVECHWGRFQGWFRVNLRGQNPWAGSKHSDPHGLTCGEDPGPFAQRVRDAAALATPLALDDVDRAAELVDDAADAKPEPTVAGRFAKGFGKALVNGFFNTR